MAAHSAALVPNLWPTEGKTADGVWPWPGWDSALTAHLVSPGSSGQAERTEQGDNPEA